MTRHRDRLTALPPELAAEREIHSFACFTKARVTSSHGRCGTRRLTVSDVEPHVAQDALWAFFETFPVLEHWIENGKLVIEMEVR